MADGDEARQQEIEGRARRAGWVPQDEFRGNPDNWKEPEEFLRVADESLPHAKGTIKTMERKMAQQEELLRQQNITIEELKNTLTEFVDFSRGAEERAYKKAVAKLQAKQKTAKEAGDLEAFVEATEKIDALIAEHPTVTGKDKPAGDATGKGGPKTPQQEYQEWLDAEPDAFDDWKVENTWFEDDPEMFAYAGQMDQFLHAKHGLKLSRSQRLEKLTELVKKKFPEKFGNPARKSGSPVEGDSGGRPGGNGKHSYNDLPPDAKKQCDKWCGTDGKGEKGTIPGFTREQYLKQYRW